MDDLFIVMGWVREKGFYYNENCVGENIDILVIGLGDI